MSKFSIPSGPCLVAVSFAMVLSYFALKTPAPAEARLAAVESAAHTALCPVCRLPVFGQDGQASKFGPPSHDDETDAAPAGR